MTEPSDEARIALTDALVALSATDLPYGDLYLHRAQQVLEPVLNAERYRALHRERDGLPDLARQLRALIGRGDWSQVHELAQRGIRHRQRVADNERLLALGDAVYAPRLFRAHPASLALAGFTVDSDQGVDSVRNACIDRLRFALRHDGDLADFYRERLAYMADRVAVTNGATPVAPDTVDLHRRILEAAENADFALAERLSAAIMGAAASDAGHRSDGALPAGCRDAPALIAPFADAAISRAQDIGLTAVTLAADAALGSYLCARDMILPDALAPAAHADGTAEGGDCACWRSLTVTLRDAFDLLRDHPCMTSAGSRYLPTFGAETLLVEAFSEGEPDTRTGLLDALALPRRRGLSRLAIEDAVRSHTPRVCAALGLDPTRHAVIAVPFDAYLRLAPRFNWGGERLWTHFDGYQATHGLTLRALVGGDAGYGGAADLCSVARDYESERIVTRFCIVRRERLTAGAG